MKEPGRSKIWITDIITGLFMLLFIYAAISKLLDFQKFQVQLAKSPLLTAFASWMAWIVPATEIGICILLAFKKTQLTALYAAFTLMVIFSAYIVVILDFSEYIPCSCGGILENMNWSEHLWFNFLFVVLAAAAVLLFPVRHKEVIGQ